MQATILVTGGAGYIGSHTSLCLLQAGYDVVVLDNLCNSSVESLRRIKKICGRAPNFVQGDVCDQTLLDNIFTDYNINSVIHFAGLKSVADSVEKPLEYYRNNVMGSINLCEAMKRAGVYSIVFSSSAAIYGQPKRLPVTEDCPAIMPSNPYGRTKLMVEQMLSDLAESDSRWSIALLRYFNPVGAHKSGLIGESPRGIPTNLVPSISWVLAGKIKKLKIFGDDYPTIDGTGVRDYVHVLDLARGHLLALQALNERHGLNVWNFGAGKGYSVLQIIQAYESASGCSIPHEFVARRSGDIAECWADTTKAYTELGWKPEYDLESMILDTWRWISQNPNGYLK